MHLKLLETETYIQTSKQQGKLHAGFGTSKPKKGKIVGLAGSCPQSMTRCSDVKFVKVHIPEDFQRCMCLELDHFLDEQFPEEYRQRRDTIESEITTDRFALFDDEDNHSDSEGTSYKFEHLRSPWSFVETSNLCNASRIFASQLTCNIFQYKTKIAQIADKTVTGPPSAKADNTSEDGDSK
ncbi:hypothetical protein Fmac_011301 [Flemingia macrophylla]|uniref:Uncharacterized protein n=1 Tax=Flemingia macrophylla TaxID=520843 RepID=A0ABD1MM22_9FABA